KDTIPHLRKLIADGGSAEEPLQVLLAIDVPAAQAALRDALSQPVRCRKITPELSKNFVIAHAASFLPVLIELLADRAVRPRAATLLAEMGAKAVPPLTAALQGARPDLREGAC